MIKLSQVIRQLQDIHAQYGDTVGVYFGTTEIENHHTGQTVIRMHPVNMVRFDDFSEDDPGNSRKAVSFLQV